MKLKQNDDREVGTVSLFSIRRRRLIFSLSAIFLSFFSRYITTFAQEQSNTRIFHVIGSSILPFGDSIVMVVGQSLEDVVAVRLSVQEGEAEIIMRDSTHLAIRVNPKNPMLVGNISLHLSLSNGWGHDINIRLICDPTQLCFDPIEGRYQTESRYFLGTRYAGSSRYSAPRRYSVPGRYSGNNHYYFPQSDKSDKEESELLTLYIGEQLL